jgi:TRAP-type transport system small permease protein
MNADPAPSSPAVRLLSIVGGVALLFAMAVDVISVIGRHIKLPLLGSIELVQAAVVVSASAGMIVATIARSHAVVHLVVDRLSSGAKVVVLRIAAALSALFFLALAIGSGWVAADMIGGHEESELLHIPYAPLRFVLVAATLAVAAIFAAQAIGRVRR